MRKLVYEIFVDRFAGDGGRALDPVAAGDPWKVHAGGTLDGIAARLDHLVALGVDAIYLTPIFRAPTNHKYDTTSFDEVDPAFGGDAAFAKLAAACRARGLGLILDGVFNHVGEGHEWFRRAQSDPADAFAQFFKFTRHPDRYAQWRGFGFLPELDLDRAEVLDAIEAIMRAWILRGATGWRLDCANDLGRSVCARLTKLAPPDGVIGEVMTYGREWVEENRLDGVMNYYFRESVLGMCTGRISGLQAAHHFEVMAREFPRRPLLQSWNVLATHDTPRLASAVADPRARALAFVLAFTYPGTPLVYYGEEMGMTGGADPDNRRPMVWEGHDRATFELIRRLAELRKTKRALFEGNYLPCGQPGTPSLLAFARTTDDPEDVVVVVANGSESPVSARVFLPYSYLFDHLPMVDLLGVASPVSGSRPGKAGPPVDASQSRPGMKMLAGRIDVALEPYQAVVLAPDDTTIPGYRFFRRR